MGSCRDIQRLHLASHPRRSAIMFAFGVVGNVLALVLLEVRRRKQSPSLFHVLVTALVLTDLLGTFSVSPLVISAYHQNLSLLGLGNGSSAVCAHFGFSMTFLSLVTLAVLLCMAVERWLAIGYPYLYERRVSVRCGYVLLPVVYLACALFCLAPFLGLGFGKYVQYCPGSWCFLDLYSDDLGDKVYKNVYASWLLLMIACTVLCNASVSYHLLLMYRRSKTSRSSLRRFRGHRSLSISEEVNHLVLLGFMTTAFVICSLPLVVGLHPYFLVCVIAPVQYSTHPTKLLCKPLNTAEELHQPLNTAAENVSDEVVYVSIRVYISMPTDNPMDLSALLLLSLNPIIDPWVFIILRSPVPRLLWEKLRKTYRSRTRHKKMLQTRPESGLSSIELQKQNLTHSGIGPAETKPS
ncbi:hypothetical protein NFI96_028805 [Prochilodus magdalenae]|nr:hypothetical protein NFI96_028805 [Prochilodus magdalenae]